MVRKFLAALAVLIATPALAQVSSPATQVQGPPTDINRGNPVKMGCTYNSGGVTATDTRVQECQSDSTGAIRVTVTSSGTTSARVQGTATHGLAAVGDPVQAGGVFDNAYGTLDTGDVGRLRLNAGGALYVTPTVAATGADASSNSLAFALTNNNSNGILAGAAYGFNGTNWDRARGDTNGLVVQPGLSSTFWYYTSGASPILSNTTTAVTIKTAAGASVRNFIDSCQVTTTAFGASVPLALRDGAGGSVIFALTVPTSGFLQPVVLKFEPPLRSTANTLIEVVTTTANTSGTVTLNCQGHTGT